MKKVNVQEALERITKKDPRYDRDAYLFVREALDYTLKSLRKQGGEEPLRAGRELDGETGRPLAHVKGQELIEGIRDLALKQFGPLARTVFEHWGVNRCEDFGEIVFHMVDAGLLGKTDTDSKSDFAGGYNFDDAFAKPFRRADQRDKGAARDDKTADSPETGRGSN